MTTHDLRAEYGLTQKQLAEIFDIPLRTVQNWDSRGCCPAFMHLAMKELLARDYQHTKGKE